jgi:hypothetical protein
MQKLDHPSPDIIEETENWCLVLAQTIAGAHRVSEIKNAKIKIQHLDELGTTTTWKEVDPTSYIRLINPIYENSWINFDSQPIDTPSLVNKKNSDAYDSEFYFNELLKDTWAQKVEGIDTIIFNCESLSFDDLEFIVKLLSVTLYSSNPYVQQKSLSLISQLICKFEKEFMPYIFQLSEAISSIIGSKKPKIISYLHKIFFDLQDTCLEEIEYTEFIAHLFWSSKDYSRLNFFLKKLIHSGVENLSCSFQPKLLFFLAQLTSAKHKKIKNLIGLLLESLLKWTPEEKLLSSGVVGNCLKRYLQKAKSQKETTEEIENEQENLKRQVRKIQEEESDYIPDHSEITTEVVYQEVEEFEEFDMCDY